MELAFIASEASKKKVKIAALFMLLPRLGYKFTGPEVIITQFYGI